ncbi:hypothetical protein CRG98_011423 [Punica granatum]|uniref:Uncharacterized protein n=1 Tax=Punica granatum TaxID=22663 RepID=A0A2I0KHY7_PUNGR|nr:hypothetical protein CRG98_011423 [Punica granatum]
MAAKTVGSRKSKSDVPTMLSGTHRISPGTSSGILMKPPCRLQPLELAEHPHEFLDEGSDREMAAVAAWRSTGWRVASCRKNESDDMAIKAKEK